MDAATHATEMVDLFYVPDARHTVRVQLIPAELYGTDTPLDRTHNCLLVYVPSRSTISDLHLELQNHNKSTASVTLFAEAPIPQESLSRAGTDDAGITLVPLPPALHLENFCSILECRSDDTVTIYYGEESHFGRPLGRRGPSHNRFHGPNNRRNNQFSHSHNHGHYGNHRHNGGGGGGSCGCCLCLLALFGCCCCCAGAAAAKKGQKNNTAPQAPYVSTQPQSGYANYTPQPNAGGYQAPMVYQPNTGYMPQQQPIYYSGAPPPPNAYGAPPQPQQQPTPPPPQYATHNSSPVVGVPL